MSQQLMMSQQLAMSRKLAVPPQLAIRLISRVLYGSFLSVGVHEGPPPRRSQEGSGGARKSQEEGARKSPLAPARRRKIDERYSTVFPGSETDEKLPYGSHTNLDERIPEHIQDRVNQHQYRTNGSAWLLFVPPCASASPGFLRMGAKIGWQALLLTS